MIGTVPPVSHPRPPGSLRPDQPTLMPLRASGPIAAPETVELRPQASASRDDDGFVGQELCGYVILRKLAEGGMGVVYEGQHTKIGRIAAIKVLKLEFCRAEDVVERFYQEARAVNSIRHENIVDIYDFGRDAHGRVFFVMEYLEGEPLAARIRRGALTWPEAFPILEQTLRALKAAHDKGFVHRDLKPDNIWLRYVDGRIQVKLLDFGIAKLVGAESPREKLTQTGSVIGTPHYMSPEQINGSKDVDQRTDLYALGVITYEMFAGVTPFVGDTLQAIMTGHLFREPPRLADIPANLGVPAQIAEIIDRMLVKDAAGRYDSVGEVLDDLYDVHMNRWPTHAETLNRVRPTRGPTRIDPVAAPPAPVARKRGRGGLIALLAVAALAGGGFAVWRLRSQAPAQPVEVARVAPPAPVPPPAPVVRPPDEAAARKDAEAVLRAALQRAEPIVRVQGADALGAIKDQPSVSELSKLTETDDDLDVRGHSAGALAQIGATASAALLARLETGAPPPLKVWYAAALARLGDRPAAKRLLGYAGAADLAVAFPAALALADLSQPGDAKAVEALWKIAEQATKLPDEAGVVLLTKLAGLRDAVARKQLHAMLEQPVEATRLAAAEGLARLGDDAGRDYLHATASNPAAPNRLIAAAVQVALGDYGGADVLHDGLANKDPELRIRAARALGDIAEKTALPALLALAGDADWTVRIAAARAVIAIVGIDPAMLAQASVDWTRSALASQDWATRKAAAGVLADIPSEQAVPLLAQAIADHNTEVRLAASKSAGKIKIAEVAAKVVAAVASEADPEVQEQHIKSLGAIGAVAGPAAHDTLAQLAEKHSRLGLLAAGSLIAVGDDAGQAKLIAAVAPASLPELRLAAVEAAAATGSAVVMPTLKIGVLDKIFSIKFLAAEGLATLNSEQAVAVPVLTEALASKDPDVVGRALAALTRFGAQIQGAPLTPAQMIDSPDPRQRLAAVSIVRAMPAGEGVPLLRRLVVDPDAEVRHAGVDAIESVVVKDRDAAKRLYKPLVKDADPVVRSKAAGQLARLVDPPVQTAQTAPATVDPQAALADVTAASTEAAQAKEAYDVLASDFARLVAAQPAGDPSGDPSQKIERVRALPAQLDDAAKRLEASARKVEAAAQAAATAAGVSPPDAVAQRLGNAREMAKLAREDATRARGTAASAAKEARRFIESQTDGVLALIASADTAIGAGNLAVAQASLDRAARRQRELRQYVAALDQSYAHLYEAKAKATPDADASAKLMQQAAAAYLRITKAGSGPLVELANKRIAEIREDEKPSP